MTEARLLRDTEIIQALAEDWSYESTVSPGFDRNDAELASAPNSALKVVDCAPRSLYERLVFPFLLDKRDVAVWNVPFFTMDSRVQHAFLDPKDPLGGGLHNSITIIESRYNLLNYNDGYHASHHLNAQRHWSEHPREFLRRKQIYLDSDAIILKGTDYDGVFGLLMIGAYEKLAGLMVDLGGKVRGPHHQSVRERAAWLRERTRKFTWVDLERIYGVEALNVKFGEAVVSAGLEGRRKTKASKEQ
ncbi:hypothetical protein HDU83_009137 [Entophlyctis luteolus]|nr:hypothetical protein HDU82_002387 [Entophlyctis luteolus]KAJ3356967.1 hypothetical protein HDU83_009137 [Entophlyctis luteolus]KAJ3394269.1 hypothetical protein HDU84_009024 [Entophlyctis sp. JEL0112]